MSASDIRIGDCRDELIVDAFAGGGGASSGIERALGVSPDIAINHDAVALAMHAANHPHTKHLNSNIWKVDPNDVEPGRPIGLLWASPDCTHHSKAKGGVPIRHEGRNSRDLGWIVVLWAKRRRPRVIILENVEEWLDWGPLIVGADGSFRPCPDRKGVTFKRWVRALRRLGYQVEWRELRACAYGAPTIRKRLYVIARRDGEPIVWPAFTHGAPGDEAVIRGRLQPWRTAADIIDWSLPCPSIFDTAEEIMRKHGLRAIRPLAANTMARIARGVKRYVLDAAQPFIVPITHAGDLRAHPADEPMRTVTAAHRGEHALVTPFVTKFRRGATGQAIGDPLCTVTANSYERRPGGAAPIGLVAPHLMTMRNAGKPFEAADQPAHTITASGAHLHLVAAFLAQHNYMETGHDAREPVSTIVGKGSTQAVVSAGLVNMRGSDADQLTPRPPDAPLATLTGQGTHAAEVRAFLLKYYGAEQDPRLEEPLHTATTKARFGLVTVMIGGEPYVIVDIGMRMLTPRELFRAQGFDNSYVIDRTADGTPITKTDQIRMCGNSVCPPVAAALVRANYSLRAAGRATAPAFALQAAE